MNILEIIRNNAPSILNGMAIFGATWSAIEAVKATPKAMRILEEKEIDPRKQPKEAVKATWKCYIFPAGILLGTIISQCGVLLLLENDKMKLIGALAYSEVKRQELRAANKAIFGDQAEAIDAEINKPNTPAPTKTLKEGMFWCYEPESKQWFQTNTEEILHVQLVANKMFQNHGKLTFNQFLGLFKNAKKVDFGDHFGWYIYDENGAWDYNWSFYPGGTPWIDIQPQIDNDGNLILAYGMHPGDDLDCNDIEEPEQFVIQNAVDWVKRKS